MRLKRYRISKIKPVEHLLRNYGVGGVEKYDSEQVYALLVGLALILDYTGLIEMKQVGKFLIQLSDGGLNLVEKAIEELEQLGYYPAKYIDRF